MPTTHRTEWRTYVNRSPILKASAARVSVMRYEWDEELIQGGDESPTTMVTTNAVASVLLDDGTWQNIRPYDVLPYDRLPLVTDEEGSSIIADTWHKRDAVNEEAVAAMGDFFRLNPMPGSHEPRPPSDPETAQILEGLMLVLKLVKAAYPRPNRADGDPAGHDRWLATRALNQAIMRVVQWPVLEDAVYRLTPPDDLTPLAAHRVDL